MEYLENDDIFYMKQALEEAHKAAEELEVPVGAVIVHDKKIISRGRNHRESLKNSLCHAEIEAIHNACETLQRWRLTNCTMYVTLEPCPMCAGAIINARMKKIYIGTLDEKTGAAGSVLNLFEDYKFNHEVEVEKGIMKEQCESMLKDFFKNLRRMKKANK